MQRLLLTDKNESCLIGYVDFIILNKKVNINQLFIYKFFRGKKYGTYILYKLIQMMIKTRNKKITLENCTKNNMYKNLGFYYIDNNDPYMELNLKNFKNIPIILLENIENIENKVKTLLFSF